MREILFRGKTTKDKEWVYGDLLHDGYDYDVAIWEQECKLVTEISPETVGQFTGLTDKNCKKIFEGDIVKSEFTQKLYIVCFGEYTYINDYGEEESACGWYNKEEGGYVTAFGSPDAWATVVGNIHDNPELLGGASHE